MICRCLLASLATLCISVSARAQQSPRFSGSLLLGPEQTSGGEFRNTEGVAIEIAGTARLAVVHDVAFMATAAYGGIGGTGTVTSICIPSSRGGCKPDGANLGGLSLRIGVERSLAAHLAVGASFGTGWYANQDGTHPRGARALPVTLALFVPVVSHVTIAAAAERIAFRDFGGVNFYSTAFLIGLRGQ